LPCVRTAAGVATDAGTIGASHWDLKVHPAAVFVIVECVIMVTDGLTAFLLRRSGIVGTSLTNTVSGLVEAVVSRAVLGSDDERTGVF